MRRAVSKGRRSTRRRRELLAFDTFLPGFAAASSFCAGNSRVQNSPAVAPAMSRTRTIPVIQWRTFILLLDVPSTCKEERRIYRGAGMRQNTVARNRLARDAPRTTHWTDTQVMP